MTALNESTALVDRPLLLAHASVDSERRAGAYRIERRLVRAPGTDLWSGSAPDGTAIIIQSVVLRAVHSHAEAVERGHVERAIVHNAAGTFERPNLIAQGAADRAGGLREIYWVLKSPIGIPSADPIQVGLDLAHQLAADHLRGSCAPLLDAALLVNRDERAAIVGVPVAAPIEWLAPGALAWRSAPEESIRRSPCPSGDLWRLGQTLASLAHGRTIPAGLEAIIDALTGPAHRRPARATEVIVALEALTATGQELATVHYSAARPGAIDELLSTAAPTLFEVPEWPQVDGTTVDAAAPIFDAPAETIAVVTMVPSAPEDLPIVDAPVARIGVPIKRRDSIPLITDAVEEAFFEQTPAPTFDDHRRYWLAAVMIVGAALGILAALQ